MNATIFEHMTFDEYLAIEAINASSLVYARQSMGHVRAALDGKLITETAATKFGSLVHCLTLEPHTFDAHYVIEPPQEQFCKADGSASDGWRNTKAYKEWKREQGARVVLSKEELDKAKECTDAVLSHPLAKQFLTPGGRREVVLVWTDPTSGVRCKIRVDWLGEFTTDLKTTADTSDFEWAIGKWDYDIKGAFYRRGVMAATGEWKDVALVAVESSGYPAVRASKIDPLDLDAAEAQIDEWLDRVRVCQMSGVWPGPDSPPTWKCMRRSSTALDVEQSAFAADAAL